MLFPGELIEGPVGVGTYQHNGVNRASVKGILSIDGALSSIQNSGQIVPKISNLVMCRVFKVTYNMAQVHILSVENRVLKSYFLGIIRLPDIRKHEIEKIVLEDCFQPGDIVQAKVISLGDSKWFYLSTAEDHLGVVLASHENKRLLPYSWEEMIDPTDNKIYHRKVARPLVIQ